MTNHNIVISSRRDRQPSHAGRNDKHDKSQVKISHKISNNLDLFLYYLPKFLGMMPSTRWPDPALLIQRSQELVYWNPQLSRNRRWRGPLYVAILTYRQTNLPFPAKKMYVLISHNSFIFIFLIKQVWPDSYCLVEKLVCGRMSMCCLCVRWPAFR